MYRFAFDVWNYSTNTMYIMRAIGYYNLRGSSVSYFVFINLTTSQLKVLDATPGKVKFELEIQKEHTVSLLQLPVYAASDDHRL